MRAGVGGWVRYAAEKSSIQATINKIVWLIYILISFYFIATINYIFTTMKYVHNGNMYRHLSIWHVWNKIEWGFTGYFKISDSDTLERYPCGKVGCITFLFKLLKCDCSLMKWQLKLWTEFRILGRDLQLEYALEVPLMVKIASDMVELLGVWDVFAESYCF